MNDQLVTVNNSSENSLLIGMSKTVTDVNTQSKSTSTQVTSRTASNQKIAIWSGRKPQSYVVKLKLGQRFVGIRELPICGVRKCGTQTEDELATPPNSNTGTIEATHRVTLTNSETPTLVAVTTSMSKPERLRMQWRDSKRRCRSLYLNNYLYDKLEFLPDEQRNRQVERSRISNAAVRQNRTENEWAEVRKKHQI